MKVDSETGRLILWNDHEDWEEIETSIIDNDRWSIIKEGVFKHIPTGKFYRMNWRIGATEYQDERPFEYHEPELVEVVQKEKLVKVWVDAKD